MKPKKPTGPVPGPRTSQKQAEEDRKILENLVNIFPKEKLLDLIQKGYVWHEALILESSKVVVESIARNMIRLWVNILLEAQKKSPNNKTLRLKKNLIPPQKAFANPDFLKTAMKWNVLARFGLHEKQVAAFLQSFTQKVAEQVETTGAVQLPKNLWLKKDTEGFYLEY